ncbi:MAG TPA: hypothetical protein VLJ61_04985 [Pyrinomonadaceae bacterium]|nr:hypothetical protein [Pyrinomonadaceae bacterium]
MLDKYAFKFYLLGFLIEGMHARLPQHDTVFDAQLPDDFKNAFRLNMQHVENWCQEIRLIPVATYAHSCLNTPPNQLTYKKVRKMLEGVKERMSENLNAINFKLVPPHLSGLYKMTFPFGQKVADRFPSASYDIAEASKCFALERNTACVMHLMRAAEVGLKAYG